MSKLTGNTVLDIIIVLVVIVAVTAIAKGLLSGIKLKNGRVKTIITILESTIQYVAAIVGMIWILRILDVNVATIFASVGIVALVVGFSAESLIADVITGIFMIFENQFNVGDVVEIEGYRGTVDQIGIRTISIRDTGDNVKIINNSNIKNIVNLSSDLSKAVCDIGISYEDDLETVEAVLQKVLEDIYESHRDIFQKKPEYAGVQELAASSIVLRIIAEVDEKNIFIGRRIMNRALLLGLTKAGISLPYNQLVVRGQ